MVIWPAIIAPALGALGSLPIATALLRALRQRDTSRLGRWRWLALAAAAGGAALQAACASCVLAGIPGRVPALALAAGFCQALLGVSLWPVVTQARTLLRDAIGRRQRLRLELVQHRADDAQACLEMAAQAVKFGHWRIDLASHSVAWSDEMYHLHGLSSAAFTPSLECIPGLFAVEDQKTVSGSLAMLLAGPAACDINVRLLRPDGEARRVVLRASTQGSRAINGVLVDVTGQGDAGTALREANAAALRANAALKDMTLEDTLTGLSNRRQFDLSLVHEFKRALRSQIPLGLVLIDLDHFASYNEIYGQAAGDACLRRVAQTIKSVPRRTGDLVARHGGAELAVLLPLADDHGAARVATVISAAVQDLHIAHKGSEAGALTISCGAAAFTSVQDIHNPLELVRRADQALYKAKANGRDRVARYEHEATGDLRSAYVPALAQEQERFIKSRS